ncbi:MAG: hypothetical protein WD711_00870, partial [Dongiaceae bacterium]
MGADDQNNASGTAPRAVPAAAELEAGVRRLAPFHHDIELKFGVRTFVPTLMRRDYEETRLSSFVNHAWPAL